jgi:hypothetical protein
MGYAHLQALINMRQSFNTRWDENDYEFTGYVSWVRDEFTRIRRSRHGRGIDFRFQINEYKGQNCNIPTSGNCFSKCYIEMEKSNIEVMTTPEIIKKYNIQFYNV